MTEDLARFAREGWKTLGDDDKERLNKWVGVFHRRPTPGHFMRYACIARNRLRVSCALPK